MILSIRDQFYKLNNDKFVGGIKKVLKGVTQIFNKRENVLVSMIIDLLKGKVENNLIGKLPKNKFKNIIVYVLGGGTYGEACDVLNLKKEFPNVNFYYGSSHYLRTQDIIEDLENENIMKSLGKDNNVVADV